MRPNHTGRTIAWLLRARRLGGAVASLETEHEALVRRFFQQLRASKRLAIKWETHHGWDVPIHTKLQPKPC